MTDSSLSSPYATLLEDMAQLMREAFVPTSPEAAFASYVFFKASETGPLPAAQGISWPSEERLVHAPALSALGYWLGSGGAGDLRGAWLQGIQRLSAREAFPSDRQSFVYRPVELLGVAVGLSTFSDQPSLRSWFAEVVERLKREPAGAVWSVALRTAAEHVLAPQKAIAPSGHAAAGILDAAVGRWLRCSVLGLKPSEEDERLLLKQALLTELETGDIAHAAVIHQSLRSAVDNAIESAVDRHWQVGRERRDAEELVVTLCRRFDIFAKQLLDRRENRKTVEVEDEYDVQDLLHALLRMHFEDVRPEEPNPSVAGKPTRQDFLLKREQIVVEAKKTRPSLKQDKVADELIIDMRRYRSHQDCRTLICFVYDPDRHCHAPTALEDDLTKDEPNFRTRVIVCPKGT
jgi:hypothetical protein